MDGFRLLDEALFFFSFLFTLMQQRLSHCSAGDYFSLFYLHTYAIHTGMYYRHQK